MPPNTTQLNAIRTFLTTLIGPHFEAASKSKPQGMIRGLTAAEIITAQTLLDSIPLEGHQPGAPQFQACNSTRLLTLSQQDLMRLFHMRMAEAHALHQTLLELASLHTAIQLACIEDNTLVFCQAGRFIRAVSVAHPMISRAIWQWVCANQ